MSFSGLVTETVAVGVGSVPTLVVMTRWTIEVDDDIAERVSSAAAERGVAPEQVAAELVASGALSDSWRRRRFAFAGMGESGPEGGDIGRRHREVIAESVAYKSARDV